MEKQINFGGFIECSFNDWPERLCCVAFVNGCNLRCRFCHNPTLIKQNDKCITEDEILSKIAKLSGKLDNMCLTGGEPLIYGSETVRAFCKKVKKLNPDIKIKLDTNGTLPKELDNVLYDKINKKKRYGVETYEIVKTGLVDYVAVDFKAGSCTEYDKLVMCENRKELCFNSLPFTVTQSLFSLLKSDIPFEIRTTLIEGFHKEEDLDFMYKLISQTLLNKKENVICYIQKYRPDVTLDADKNWKTPSDEFVERIKNIGEKRGLKIKIR